MSVILDHVSRYRLVWYLVGVAAMSASLQVWVDGNLHRLLWG